LPAALVVSNWFGANRGLALGLTGSGISLGGAGMTLVANAAIARHGWRGGYVALAIPMIVVAIPIMILMVRSRPPQVGARTTMPGAAPALELPGFELALRRRRSVRNQEVGREIQTRCPFPFINSDVISRLGSAVNGAKRSGPAEIGSFRAEPAVPRSADRNRSHRPSAVLPRPRAKPKHRPT
jgi:MFS family permease